MGWVAQKIEDHKTVEKSIPSLWNSLRDSVGAALVEFQSSVSSPSVSHSDCMARGAYCIRVQKPGRFIEIFLSLSDMSVRLASGGIRIEGFTENGEVPQIARYRLNDIRSALEFCTEDNMSASADDVAEKALGEFLFDPFPAYLRPYTL